MSRVQNSIKNMISSTFGEFLSIVLKFITRSVFIHALGTQFLGINGLFTNLLSILSLSELGIGTAITYNLYKPIAEADDRKISILMQFYKKAYRYIGVFIAVSGLLIIPLLPYVIRDDLGLININLIFVIYLMQSVSTYMFFAYKGAIIKANQKEYIINIISYYFSVGTSFVQIISLIYFKNFTLYIFIVVISNILKNLVIAIKADKMYKYLKDNNIEKLDKKELRGIIKNSYAIFLYKTNSVVLNATDNIVLSTFIGLNIVGLYSNYLLIFTTIKAFLSKFYQSINASLGNLHATDKSEYAYSIFKSLNFFTIYIHGIAAIGTYVTANYFVAGWIGEQYTLSNFFVLLLSIEIYMSGINRLMVTYRNSLGLFQQAKYRPIFGTVINLGISLWLVGPLGIYGVLLGTIIANLLTYMWYDPIIVLKHGFNKGCKEYFYMHFKYAISIFSIALMIEYLSKMISLPNLAMFLIFGLLSIIITAVIMHLLYSRTKEYKYLEKFVKKAYAKMIRKISKKR